MQSHLNSHCLRLACSPGLLHCLLNSTPVPAFSSPTGQLLPSSLLSEGCILIARPFPLPCLISLILNSVIHPSPRTVNLWQCASLHALSQMPWLLMPVLAGLELATLNDVLTLSSYSSVDESSFFDHNLSQPPTHTPLFISSSPYWVTASPAIYDFPHLANVCSILRLGKGHLIWAVPTPPLLSSYFFFWIYACLYQHLPNSNVILSFHLAINSMRLVLCLKALLYLLCLAP